MWVMIWTENIRIRNVRQFFLSFCLTICKNTRAKWTKANLVHLGGIMGTVCFLFLIAGRLNICLCGPFSTIQDICIQWEYQAAKNIQLWKVTSAIYFEKSLSYSLACSVLLMLILHFDWFGFVLGGLSWTIFGHGGWYSSLTRMTSRSDDTRGANGKMASVTAEAVPTPCYHVKILFYLTQAWTVKRVHSFFPP